MYIDARISEFQPVIPDRINFAICPNCRQKLSEFINISGICRLKIKCRRCGNFIDIIVAEM